MSKPIFIISGPSGVGEDTIIFELKKKMKINKVITSTTRDMREGEEDGVSYYFLDDATFDRLSKEGKFFEEATQYNQKRYGVTYEELERVRNMDGIPVWKIEWQGVKRAKELLGDKVVAILITAPFSQLERRIRRRGGLSEEQILDRMAYTREWMNHRDLYDYQVPNHNGKLKFAVQQVMDIIEKYS